MSQIDELQDVLVRLQVVTARQWRGALAGPADWPAVLDALAARRAWWHPGEGSAPALTDYQRRRIARRFETAALGRLPGDLRANDYLLLDRLGRGGMGVVWKAWDLARRRFVAVKRLTRNTTAARRRFRREARVLRRLDHPCIARCYSYEKARGGDLLVLEYVAGVNVEDKVKASGPLPWREAARCAIALLGALAHAHERGVVHRDVKPANVVLQEGAGRRAVKLLDLGLAKHAGGAAEDTGQLTLAGHILGTPHYMPPEQWRSGAEARPESDVYALGGTLFYMLTGRPPYPRLSLTAFAIAHASMPTPSARAARPEVPDALDRLVQRMLAKNPAERGSPAELAAQLGALLDEKAPGRAAPVGGRPPRTGPGPGPSDRTPLPWRPPAPKLVLPSERQREREQQEQASAPPLAAVRSIFARLSVRLLGEPPPPGRVLRRSRADEAVELFWALVRCADELTLPLRRKVGRLFRGLFH